ncbi:MAG: HAD family hydrolase, partial [Anaerolineae bacterium]|nr:HAD family hydrolase [Anaerolineae bacterium]
AVAEYLQTLSLNGGRAVKEREIPFNSSRKWGAVVFADETLILGAPERLLTSDSAPQARELALQGLRVLAFARSTAVLNDGQLEAVEPLALIVLSDQIRSDIRETLDAFRAQDVRLKVISGDNLETVKAIAAAASIVSQKAYTGDQLEAMSDAELEAAAQQADLFARIEPETKRRIIAALKRQGEYVAM